MSIDLFTREDVFVSGKYPFLTECFKRQQKIHWTEDEIPMKEDIVDWAINLSEEEKNFMLSIFRLFTQSDYVVSNNYKERLLPKFKCQDATRMLTAFGNQEEIHVMAYSYLLRTLGFDNAIFKEFLNHPEMANKMAILEDTPMETDEDVAVAIAKFAGFTEGLTLFSSFVMLINFPRFNLMKNMGQIVAYSIRDEALHVEGMMYLFKEFLKQTGVSLSSIEGRIKEIALKMVALEDSFIDLAFEGIHLKGLDPEEVKEYIRYLCDWRLVNMGINGIFDCFEIENGYIKEKKKDPLPWAVEYVASVAKANFFESKPTEYLKVGVLQGEIDDFSDLF